MDNVLLEVINERQRQKELSFGGLPTEDFDKSNSQADWVNFVVRYASGASPRLGKRKDLEFRQAMIKAAALAVAAVEAYDAGYAK